MPGITTSENTRSNSSGRLASRASASAALWARAHRQPSSARFSLTIAAISALSSTTSTRAWIALSAGVDTGLSRLRRLRLRDSRQIERESRALAGRALHENLAARLLGEADHLRKPQPRTLADRLGGEERLEDAAQKIGSHPCAGVVHGHNREGACRRSPRRALGDGVRLTHFYSQTSAVRHGVPSVHGEVDDRRAELARVDMDVDRRRRRPGFDCDPRPHQGAGSSPAPSSGFRQRRRFPASASAAVRRRAIGRSAWRRGPWWPRSPPRIVRDAPRSDWAAARDRRKIG